jgi:hypothetical protein
MAVVEPLDDVRVPTRYKLSALWTSVMFLYIYADYFELYVPGKLQGMLAGKMAPLGPVTQTVLLGTTAMLALPSLMIFLSVALRASVTRWLNIVAGVIYSVIQVAVISGSGWTYYVAMGLMETALTALIVGTAWKWPRSRSAETVDQLGVRSKIESAEKR